MPQIVCRGFWRRWILLVLLCFIIIIAIMVWKQQPDVEVVDISVQKFDWLSSDNTTLSTCRNSKQGRTFISDEKGYVCRINEVLMNGCCNIEGNSTLRYHCMTCQTNRCCKIFENCISCCLHPNKRRLLENVLVHAQKSRNPLLRSVTDKFELCLHKCRTSSSSVVRENTYRDRHHKYCFGNEVPDTVEAI